MRTDDHVASMVRIPRKTYTKLVKSKEETKCSTINKRLCTILEEYFEWKKAQKTVVLER